MLENLRTVSLLKQYGMVLIIWEINNDICKIKSHTIRKKKKGNTLIVHNFSQKVLGKLRFN